MGLDKITQRQIVGEFYKTLMNDPGTSWISAISMMFNSDQDSEEYAWLGMVPAMRQWIGGRNAKGFSENGLTIENKHFEATIKYLVKDLRRDKTGQVMARIRDLARRTNSHWASLLSTLILSGAATTCYDGQYFFDTDHSEGDSGTQSNDISVDISELPVATAGSTTNPAIAEMQFSIAQAIQAIAGFKDDQGEPMNEDARSFLVMVPMSLYNNALQAVATPVQVAETQSALQAMKGEFSIRVAPNVRLSDWTANFAVFRTDAEVKPFIRQSETEVSLKVKGEGSEYEFDNDAHQYGVDVWRNVGFGFWQMACLVTMT
ncbi:MAG: Mu-like prophage major head subunit gpT family protein [Gammaproteobacteria bacterium]